MKYIVSDSPVSWTMEFHVGVSFHQRRWWNNDWLAGYDSSWPDAGSSGKISSSISCITLSETTKKSGQTIRTRQRTHYLFECRRVCWDMFKFLHGISQDQLALLIKWYKVEDIVPQEKKAGRRTKRHVELRRHQKHYLVPHKLCCC